jgi:hypothetical protein
MGRLGRYLHDDFWQHFHRRRCRLRQLTHRIPAFRLFVISAKLRLSGFYNLVAEGIAARLGHPARFLLVLL